MTLHRICVGCDVSKLHLDFFDQSVGRPERIANTPEAVSAFVQRWTDAPVFVVFEATGGYDRVLAQGLSAAGIAHARINPARARDFARAIGRIAKTDAIDAAALAAFAEAIRPIPAHVPDPERNRLALLAKRRDQLVLMRAQEQVRASEAQDAWVREHTQRHLDFLDAEIEALNRDLAAAIEAAPALNHAATLLRSAPGVGPVTASQLLAQMPELGQISAKEVAALAGLAPMNVDSGQFRGARSIKGGRRRVRQALYMAALNAVRRASPFKDLYTRLRAAGKPAKLALIAVARKLLVTLNAIIRDQKPYQAAALA
jgi:transposase